MEEEIREKVIKILYKQYKKYYKEGKVSGFCLSSFFDELLDKSKGRDFCKLYCNDFCRSPTIEGRLELIIDFAKKNGIILEGQMEFEF